MNAKNKKLLVVVDMQGDFLTGALANPDAVAAIPAVIEEIEKADEIVFTRDTHHADYLDTQEGRRLPVPHCIEGTEGWEVNPALLDAAKKRGVPYGFVDKPTFGFDWSKYGLDPEVGEVVFVGTCTDICVISNVATFKMAYPEVPVAVRTSACAGVTPQKHEAALEVMRSLQADVRD